MPPRGVRWTTTEMLANLIEFERMYETMKIVQINSTCGSGSTGKICVAVSKLLTAKGIENYILYTSGSSSYPQGKRYMSKLEIKWQALKSRICGYYGFQSKKATKRLLAELENIAPDIVHLHNLHSHNVHLGELFTYLKEKKIKVFWTFHDCWAFTGYCPHYSMIGCNQWRMDGCKKCLQRSHYSWFFDRSRFLFEKKKELFTGLDLTIISPSQWLADQVKQSFFQDTPIRIIYNGINLSVFSPKENEIRKNYNIENRFIVLGVAFGWGRRKGLDAFIRLAEKLDKRFQIILVGTNDMVDKQLPDNIISIHRTANQQELAEIYSAADVFVNPTREEVFGLVNVEANACGTPVITYRTGGSTECIDETSGIVVDCDDEEALYETILKVEDERPFSPENCRKQALNFSEDIKYREYIELYKELVEVPYRIT